MYDEKKRQDFIFVYLQKIKPREGFSFSWTRTSLRAMCEYKGYEIYDVYKDAGISAKTGKFKARNLIDFTRYYW